MSRKVLFRVAEQVEIVGGYLGIAAHIRCGLLSDQLIGSGRLSLSAILVFAFTLLTDVPIFDFFVIDEALGIYLVNLIYLKRVALNCIVLNSTERSGYALCLLAS